MRVETQATSDNLKRLFDTPSNIVVQTTKKENSFLLLNNLKKMCLKDHQ